MTLSVNDPLQPVARSLADPAFTHPQTMAALGQVMGELVHDLANEVQVLHGWALLARGEAAVGHAAESEIERVVELSSDLVHMLRDVLETLSGQTQPSEVVFDPGVLTEATLTHHIRGMAAELRLVSSLPPGTRIGGRPTFWTRALGNLLRNAARHARQVVQVTLWTEEDERGARWVVARVEDDGPGVAPDEQGTIFRPLWRGEGGGTGLGLSAVEWLVGQLGGAVRYVEGSALGGAAFDLRVPVVRVQAQVVVAPTGFAGTAHDLDGVRLLVVDADPDSRQALTRVLRRTGAAVRELDPLTESSDGVMPGILRALPDLILLDLTSPAGGGLALWRQLEHELPHLAGRVAFLTGPVAGHPERDHAMATGQPVLVKPLDLEELVSTVLRMTRTR